MRTARLGCLTNYGIIATLITLFSIAGVAFASGSLMFTAGDLNAKAGKLLGGVNSHAEITECSDCHTALWGSVIMADRCVDCHTDIAAELLDVNELHGAILVEEPELTCHDCHPEHRGTSAPLTDMGEHTIPHDVVGFSLKAHKLTVNKEPFTCADCHQQDLSTFASNTCDDCHSQIDAVFASAHSEAYGTACLDCHDGVDHFSKPFNHADFKFKLEGGHESVACDQCHFGAHALSDFATTSQDCYACHSAKDEHKGLLGKKCGACHNPSDWKDVDFDHDLSIFKLEGKHTSIECEECHTDKLFKGTPTECYACHKKDDHHNGKFGTVCSACHVSTSWKDVTFDHDLSAFKLEGKHATIDCQECHVNFVFKGTPKDCYSCHEAVDKHNGRYGTVCSACHIPTAWKDVIFDHRLSKFPLTGAHTNAPCGSCHKSADFKGLSPDCGTCHGDPAFHSGMFGTDCASCHNTSNWSAKYRGSHPGIADEGGSGVNHGHTSCRTCHTVTLHDATCKACHDGNGGGDD
ncbi:MAG: hypothetical protein HZB50_17420 [Chloroflexi bacterium]|nr:hypothetical protein [Chloroflexota bacterium]